MITIVIPVYRSYETLEELHQRISDTFDNEPRQIEIIFVEDGGKDAAWSIINTIAQRDHKVKGIRLSRNFGQHNALLCGIRQASGEIVVTMDDDLQHPPEETPKLLARLERGADVVYGTPERERHGLLRNLASQVTKAALQDAMGSHHARQISSFRAFRTDLRNVFENHRGPDVNMDVLLSWATSSFDAVVVRRDRRKHGQSGYSSGKLVSHAFNMMTGYSSRPLQLASLVGFSFALFGAVILAYILIRWVIQGSVVPGFVFLASTIAIFSGVQLLALGVIGEYVGRIHMRTIDRPSYVVRETTSGSTAHGIKDK